jgi:hypothetical protein
MKHDVKVFLWVGAAVLGLLGLLVVGAGTLLYLNKDRLLTGGRDAIEEGRKFGESATQDACLDEALRQAEGKGPFGSIGPNLFLAGCLRSAQESNGFCDDVPPTGEIMASATWRGGRCAEAGRPNDQACVQLMSSVQRHCRPQ